MLMPSIFAMGPKNSGKSGKRKEKKEDSPSLEFGFSPLNSIDEPRKLTAKKSVQTGKEIYFDEFLDTLQAPGSGGRRPQLTSRNRSPKYFNLEQPKPRSFQGEEKQEKKSHLDFLGSFHLSRHSCNNKASKISSI